MSLKRGGLPQGSKMGDFNGSGLGGEDGEPAQRATAAQMAKRQIKQPRGRLGASRPAAPSSPFGSISGNAGQPNGAAPNGFGAQAQGASFSFGASQPAPSFSSANNGTNGSQNSGYSGSLFNLPGSQSQSQPAPQSTNMFSSPGSFNFGGDSSSQNGSNTSFSFGKTTQDASVNGTDNGRPLHAIGRPFGSTPPNPFGSANQAQSTSMFSTPAPQQTTNLFGQSTAAAAPATAPAPAPKTNLFGAPSQPQANSETPKPLFNFGTSQQNSGAATPTPSLFGASKQDSSADTSMGSPEQVKTTKSATTNLFGASSQAPSTLLFGKVDQKKASETPNAESQTPARGGSIFDKPAASAAPTPSLFSGFGQPTASAPQTGAATPASSLFDKPSAPPATITDGIFNSSPAPQNLFPAPQADASAGSTSFPTSSAPSKSPELPAAPKSPFSFQSSSSQAPTSNLFSSAKPADNKVAASEKTLLFGTKPATPTPTSTNPFGTPSQPSAARANQSTGSAFSSTAKSMSTLNSAAAPSATAGLGLDTPFQVDVPVAPAHFTAIQRHQWQFAYRMMVLDAGVEAVLREGTPGSVNGERLLEYAASEHKRLRAGLKRGPPGGDEDHGDAPSAKRINTGDKSATVASAAQPLFASSSASISAGNTLSTAPKPSSGGLFGAPAVSAEPEQPKADSTSTTDAAKTSSSLFGRPSSISSEVSYPSLGESSSKTSQLFAQISNNPTQAAPSSANKALFGASSSSMTPAGSPAKPAAPTTSATATAPPAFKVPTFSAPANGTNFFAQFQSNAKKTEAEAAEKRKDEDYDSDDGDEETWSKKDKEEQEAKRAKLLEAAKKAPGFVFDTSATPSRSPSPFKANVPAVSTPAEPAGKLEGSLFGRISKGNDGQPIRDESAANKPASSVFDTPGTPKPATNLFSNSLFGAKAAGADSDSPSSQDKTFKGDSSTPLKFSTSGPSINFTSPSPQKPAASGGSIFSSGPIGNATSLFSASQPTGSSTPGSASIFAKNPLSASLAPASVASDTSRGTSPGLTGDEATADEAGEEGASKDAQLDLAAAAAGEEDEIILFDVKSRGRALITPPGKPADSKKEWVVKGVGQLKLLRHKTTSKARLQLRTVPAAKVVLNTYLLPDHKYDTSANAGKSLGMPVIKDTGGLEMWSFSFKLESEAKELARLLEENKSKGSG